MCVKVCLNKYHTERHKARGLLEEDIQIKRNWHHSVNPVREKKLNLADRVNENSSKLTKSKSLRFYKNCFLSTYKNLSMLNIPDNIIQKVFGISQSGYNCYAQNDREAEIAYQQAMGEFQTILGHATMVKAFGYNYEEEKIFYNRVFSPTGKGKWVESKKEVYKKHHPGWAELIQFFMYNKFPKEWKKSTEVINRDQSYDPDPGQRDRKKVKSIARGILDANSIQLEGECIVSDGLARIPGEGKQVCKE